MQTQGPEEFEFFLSFLSLRTEKLVNIFENSNFNYPRVTVALRKV